MGNYTNKRTKKFINEVEKHVLDLMIKGKTNVFIIQDLMENWEYKTEANCKRTIHKVLNKCREIDDAEMDEKISMYKQMYLDLYEVALENGRVKEAREILDSITKLEGLLINKIEGKVEGVFKIEFE